MIRTHNYQEQYIGQLEQAALFWDAAYRNLCSRRKGSDWMAAEQLARDELLRLIGNITQCHYPQIDPGVLSQLILFLTGHERKDLPDPINDNIPCGTDLEEKQLWKAPKTTKAG